MKASEIFIQAKALISDRENWIQGNFAEDADGNPVSPSSDRACAFCLVGAISRIHNRLPYDTRNSNVGRFLTNALLQLHNIDDPVSFNDIKGRKYPEVLEVLDMAITMSQKEEENEPN